MNEFTKLEIMALEDALTNQITRVCPNRIDDSPLLLKLHSMIDNYCEHDQLVLDMGTYDAVYPCKKCGNKLL